MKFVAEVGELVSAGGNHHEVRVSNLINHKQVLDLAGLLPENKGNGDGFKVGSDGGNISFTARFASDNAAKMFADKVSDMGKSNSEISRYR